MCAEVGHTGAHPGVIPEVEEHLLLLEVSSPLPGVLSISHLGPKILSWEVR